MPFGRRLAEFAALLNRWQYGAPSLAAPCGGVAPIGCVGHRLTLLRADRRPLQRLRRPAAVTPASVLLVQSVGVTSNSRTVAQFDDKTLRLFEECSGTSTTVWGDPEPGLVRLPGTGGAPGTGA